ncbi:MAG: M24 family metallopeptidase [Chloroflexi bacterium]|nr:M24 family metallopeptidase [Chloroflexota bacterium]MDA1173401.1 M24 family metallopeptidase [Chloroflexota bacterium]
MVQPEQLTPIEQAEQFLQASSIDAWLVYDYQGMNPALADLVRTSGFLTRPAFLLIHPGDVPVLLVGAVDAGQIADDGVSVQPYVSLVDVHAKLGALLAPLATVAMEYSPLRQLPRASRVDAGTVELVRSLGVDVVSSAELLQYATQRWTDEGLASHRRAVDGISAIVLDAFTEIGNRLSVGVTEHDIHEYIMGRFADAGLETDHGPVVAANSHASDPHFAPTPEASVRFAAGDWVLIDLWAKEHGPDAIYADITWTAYIGATVPDERQRVFDVVTGGRDAAAEFLRERLASGQNAQGWEADDVARRYIADAGYGEYFVHRLGHSLGNQVHAGGVNLDSIETHDTRTFLPGLGFTIEPGVYLPEFGVRSEIDLYVGVAGLEITTPVQHDVVLIG